MTTVMSSPAEPEPGWEGWASAADLAMSSSAFVMTALGNKAER